MKGLLIGIVGMPPVTGAKAIGPLSPLVVLSPILVPTQPVSWRRKRVWVATI